MRTPMQRKVYLSCDSTKSRCNFTTNPTSKTNMKMGPFYYTDSIVTIMCVGVTTQAHKLVTDCAEQYIRIGCCVFLLFSISFVNLY